MQLAVATLPRRPSHGAFHNFVRAVFAERSDRSSVLRKRRATWLHRLSQRFVARVSAMNLYARD